MFDVKTNDNATSVKKEETGIKEITKKIEAPAITVDTSDNINVLTYASITLVISLRVVETIRKK